MTKLLSGRVSNFNIGITTVTENSRVLTATGNAFISGNLDVVGITTISGLKYPTSDGSENFVLKTDGSGNLSFVDNTGGTSWVAVKTSLFTAVAGEGYFCDTSSAAFTATLPATPTLGDEVTFVDYAGTFDTNNLTVGRNSENIQGSAADLTVSVERAGLTLVYSGATQGWLLKDK